MIMSNSIDIKGLNIKDIVEELWEKADYSATNIKYNSKPEFNWNKIKTELRPNGYLEHACGKVIKIFINGSKIDSSRFDLLYGNGKANEIIIKLKKKV